MAGIGHRARVGVDAQQPALASQRDGGGMLQHAGFGQLATGGPGQAWPGGGRVGVGQAPVQVGGRLAHASLHRLLHAQRGEHHAPQRCAPGRGGGRWRRTGAVQRAVDHHAGLLAGLLRQHEAGGGGRRVGDGRAVDGLAGGRDRQRVHAQCRLVAVHWLDHRDGHHVVARSAWPGTVEHLVAAAERAARGGLEGRHILPRHAPADAQRLQLDRQRQPGLGGAVQLGRADILRADQQPAQGLQRQAGVAQLPLDGGGHGRRVALEHALAALLVPAGHQHRGHRQQRGAGQQRHRHRDAAGQPVGPRATDQRQRDRRADQHAQRVAGPPGPPGERHGRNRHRAHRHQHRHRQAGVDQAGQHGTQQAEPGHLARLCQAQRPGQPPADQRHAGGGLQHRAQPVDQWRAQRRQAAERPRIAQGQIDQKGAQQHAQQGRPPVHQGGGQRDAGTGVEGRRIAGRHGQHQGQLARQQVGQRRQQQRRHPRQCRARRPRGCAGRQGLGGGGQVVHGCGARRADCTQARELCGMAAPVRPPRAQELRPVLPAAAPAGGPMRPRTPPLPAAGRRHLAACRSVAGLPASGRWHGSRPAR